MKSSLPTIIFRGYVKLEACISPEGIAVNMVVGLGSLTPQEIPRFRGSILQDFFPRPFLRRFPASKAGSSRSSMSRASSLTNVHCHSHGSMGCGSWLAPLVAGPFKLNAGDGAKCPIARKKCMKKYMSQVNQHTNQSWTRHVCLVTF